MSIPKSKSEIIFRAHSFGKIMSNERGSDKMGATAKTELNRMYAHLFYNRRKPVDNKFVRKGTLSEEKGITMYSKQYGKMVTKNTERLTNEYFTGEPDLFKGESITKAEIITDIKCSYETETYTNSILSGKIDPIYFTQGQIYMMLTGAQEFQLAYCLVNAPEATVTKEKLSAWYAHGGEYADASPEYIAEAIEIEKRLIYDRAEFKRENPNYTFDCPEDQWEFDIPQSERCWVFFVKYDQNYVDSMIKRADEARDILWDLREKHMVGWRAALNGKA